VNLQGKVALVTGGGTGLGKEIALQLAGKGCNVAVNYSRSADDANQTVAELQNFGVRALAVRPTSRRRPRSTRWSTPSSASSARCTC
jgi:3-oxoacyl-[acyl-carrier protein] reductase